jgi:hypothetical protein
MPVQVIGDYHGRGRPIRRDFKLLRNPMTCTDGGTNPIRAAKRRYVKARHGSAGRRNVEQTESASADGTHFATASKLDERGSLVRGHAQIKSERAAPAKKLHQ